MPIGTKSVEVFLKVNLIDQNDIEINFSYFDGVISNIASINKFEGDAPLIQDRPITVAFRTSH